MKGVSSVIAIILILMIVVALAALAYTWFTGIFATLTATTATAVTTTTAGMQAQFRIESAFRPSAGVVNVTIRNTGSTDINVSTSKIGTYVDGTFSGVSGSVTCTPVICDSGAGYKLKPGSIAMWQVSAGTNCPTCPGTCTNTTKVTVETGLTDAEPVVC